MNLLNACYQLVEIACGFRRIHGVVIHFKFDHSTIRLFVKYLVQLILKSTTNTKGLSSFIRCELFKLSTPLLVMGVAKFYSVYAC